MEGNKLDFFVTSRNQQALMSLSEYETVEQLKHEIERTFNIPFVNQKITGWHTIPESDNIILQICAKCDDINCLMVMDSSKAENILGHSDTSLNNQMDVETVSYSSGSNINFIKSEMDMETEDNNIAMEIEATTRLKERLPKTLNLNIRTMSFQDAVSCVISNLEKKAMLLYLHNSQDVFSKQFITHVYNDEVNSILETSFFIVGWDIEDRSYHDALLNAIKPVNSLSSISYLITDRIGAAVCLLPENNELILFSCLRGNLPYQNMFETLKNMQVQLSLSETKYEPAGYPMKEQDELNKTMEIEATTRLKERLPKTLNLNIRTMSFQDAVSCVISNLEKKAMLLYLHNSQDVFSKQFITHVYNDEVNRILETSFFIVGWDIEDRSYHDALLNAIKPVNSLSSISHLITDRIGAAVCLLPENNELILFSCLRGNLPYQNMFETLRNMQVQLSLSETKYEPASYPMEEQDELNKKYEIEAIKSLKRKLLPNTSITFRHCTLDDAIKFICTAPFDERKALFLYLHNSAHPFSKMFSENLASGEIVTTLNRSFLVLGWDLEDPTYHDALTSALSHHVNLSVVAELVTNKVSMGLCILPVGGVISLFLCLRGKMSLRETIKNLKEVEKVFKEEIEKEKELKKLESEKSNENDLGSEKLHSIWADMLGDRDYDSFEYDQHRFLKDKIGFALRGPPQKESGYEKKVLSQIEDLYKTIHSESNKIAEFKDKIEISFIYNCLEPLPKEKVKRGKKYPDYNPQTDVNPVPIFVLRKCRGSNDPCRIFIDDTGRVYENWTNYITKNKFPECDMIVPLNGRYQVVNDKVLLEKHLSPACHLDTKLLLAGDIITTAVGLASGAVFLAAAIPAITVAAPVLIGAAAFGVGAGVWAIGRSAYTLYDRSKHKESLSFANSEARGAYLNIVAGSLGFVGAGANMALTQLVKSGANIGQGATYFVNTVGIMNIATGGVSLANSGYDVIDQWVNEDKAPSALTILQLGTSVLFFGHAVYNFKGAQTIVDETQARVLKDYQDSLRSNRHRKTFNKLMKETLRTHGDGARGRAEVISAIRNIQNKDEVFAALTRNNKAMNKAGIKFSANGGQIRLDGIAVDMNEFIGLNKKQSETFLNNLSQSSNQQRTTSTTGYNISFKAAVKDLLKDINVDTSGPNLTQFITLTAEFLIYCSGDIKTKVVNAIHQVVSYVLSQLCGSVSEEIDKIIPKNTQFFEFLRLGVSFFSRKVDEWEQKYQRYEKSKDQTYFNPLFEKINPLYAKRIVTFFEFVVRNSYSGETLTRAVLMELSGYITAWVTRIIFEHEEKLERERRRKLHSAGFKTKKVDCPNCGGYYFSHE